MQQDPTPTPTIGQPIECKCGRIYHYHGLVVCDECHSTGNRDRDNLEGFIARMLTSGKYEAEQAAAWFSNGGPADYDLGEVIVHLERALSDARRARTAARNLEALKLEADRVRFEFEGRAS